MVKFRGIEIAIVSQFDICKLPEFRLRQTSPSPDAFRQQGHPHTTKATASCYVPIYPGSQIWLEYSIDGPHPPKAAYLFKLLFSGKPITSFDCTEKHNYHGKMMYNLLAYGRDETTGDVKMIRQALNFASEVEEVGQEDIIELRVHRIEHKVRIRDMENLIANPLSQNDTLQLTNGGVLEPGFPTRRYKYQLLDPVDEPYATFKFFCRTHEHFERRGIIEPIPERRTSPVSSEQGCDSFTNTDHVTTIDKENQSGNTTTVTSRPPEFSIKMVPSPSDTTDTSKELGSQVTLDKHKSVASDTYLPPSDSEDDLSIVTRDSIEDLPSTVPRSPRSPRPHALSEETKEGHAVPLKSSPLEPPRSPRRRLKKKLTVNLNGVDFNLEKNKRPLSPFTSSGMLRKLIPPSAPAAVTEFGPTIREEIEGNSSCVGRIKDCKERTTKTTRAERGGNSLMGFLSRRLATA